MATFADFVNHSFPLDGYPWDLANERREKAFATGTPVYDRSIVDSVLFFFYAVHRIPDLVHNSWGSFIATDEPLVMARVIRPAGTLIALFNDPKSPLFARVEDRKNWPKLCEFVQAVARRVLTNVVEAHLLHIARVSKNPLFDGIEPDSDEEHDLIEKRAQKWIDDLVDAAYEIQIKPVTDSLDLLAHGRIEKFQNAPWEDACQHTIDLMTHLTYVILSKTENTSQEYYDVARVIPDNSLHPGHYVISALMKFLLDFDPKHRTAFICGDHNDKIGNSAKAVEELTTDLEKLSTDSARKQPPPAEHPQERS